MNDGDVRRIYNEHKLDEHSFDYKKFIGSLKNFQFVLEDLYVRRAGTGTAATPSSSRNLTLKKRKCT